jgi:hypothetical protein
MKRKPVATQHEYKDCRYTHHGGPVAKLERRDKCAFTITALVNVRRFNATQLRRKIWLAKEDARLAFGPRLVKKAHFHNNPHI